MPVVRILVDTDVLLDVALDRAPHVEAAAALLDYLEQHPGVGFMAWHTVSNFYYLVVPRHGRDETRDLLLHLSRRDSPPPPLISCFFLIHQTIPSTKIIK